MLALPRLQSTITWTSPMRGVQFFTSDNCLGLVENLAAPLCGEAVAALCGALLLQRVDCSTYRQGEGRGSDAEGDPCAGRCQSRSAECSGDRREAHGDEARQGSGDCRRGGGRDDQLLQFSFRALALAADEQSDGAVDATDPTTNAQRWRLSR